MIGVTLIFSSAHNLSNVQLIQEDLKGLAAIPPTWIHPISISLPWIQLVLGLMLILSKRLLKYTAFAVAIIFISIIALNIINAFSGRSSSCGCFSWPLIIGKNNPLVMITEYYLILIFSIIIFIGELAPSSKLISFNSFFKGKLSLLTLTLMIAFFGSLLSVLYAKTSRESTLMKHILEERKIYISDINDNFKDMLGQNINRISDISVPAKPGHKIAVMLAIKSIDCGTCIDEAVFLEYLNTKYGDAICFFAIVPTIGNRAINDFKNKFGLTYPFIQNFHILSMPIFYKYNSLLTILSTKGEILRIDPPSFNVEEIRKEYENVLLQYFEGKNKIAKKIGDINLLLKTLN